MALPLSSSLAPAAHGEQSPSLRATLPYHYPGLVERMSLLDRGVFAEDTGLPSGVDSSARPSVFGSEPTIPEFEMDSETTNRNPDDGEEDGDNKKDEGENNDDVEKADDKNDNDKNNDDSDSDSDSDDGPFRSELKLTSTLGFDSNIDEEPGGRSSTVVQNEIEAAAEYERDGFFWRLEGEAAHDQSLRFSNEYNFEFAIAAQAGLDLSNGFRLSSGLGMKDDRIDSDGSQTSSGFVELAHAGNRVSAALRGTAEFKLHGDQTDAADNPVANELNYTKLTASSEIALLPKARLSPYLRLSLSSVEFDNGGVVNRDTEALTAVAGISARILGNLRLDIGGSYHAREVAGSWHNGSFVDAKLSWKPNEKFELLASVSREFEEIEDTDGLFVDAQTYALGLKLSPTSNLDLDLEASVSDEQNIGSLTESTEYQVEAEGQYSLNDNMNLILASSVKLAEEQDEVGSQSEYEQFTVRSGIEVKF
ncbi:MAG: outer membrane beta-barrel protein [Rhizobiaceae bacterium]